MPILDYSTKVDVYTTLGEIQSQLVKHGAKKILFDYDDDAKVIALAFMILTPEGHRAIRLPANVDAVMTVLHRDKVKADREQAERVAWRIVKDWIKAQMAILESEMVSMEQIFFPYMIGDKGKTLYERYQENPALYFLGDGTK